MLGDFPQSEQGKEQERERKTEAGVFCNLFLEITPCHFYFILSVRSELLDQAQVQGKRIIQGNE